MSAYRIRYDTVDNGMVEVVSDEMVTYEKAGTTTDYWLATPLVT